MAGRDSQDPRTVLEHLLRAQDRTYEEIAADFEKKARQLDERGVSITARHLRRLASGERLGTTPATRRVLQAMFGRPVGELLQAWNPEEEAVSTAATAPRSDVELLTMAAEKSRDFSLSKQPVTSPEVIDRLEDEVRELASVFQRTPVPTILGRLVGAQDAVLASLELRQKPTNARQLYFLAAVISGILAHVGNDLGKPAIAMDHSRSGFVWAEYADHNGLRAWIRGIQSYLCFWAGRPRQSLSYAQSGAAFARDGIGTTVSWLHASQARAWAALGNTEEVRSLLSTADDLYERTTPSDLDEFGGPCTFGRPKHLYYSARAMATLPDLAESARDTASLAVEAYQDRNDADWDYNCLADSQVSLALARLSLGELDGAAEPLRPVFELAPEQRVADIVSTVGLVHRSLNQFATDQRARDLQEQIEVFTRASLPQFPM